MVKTWVYLGLRIINLGLSMVNLGLSMVCQRTAQFGQKKVTIAQRNPEFDFGIGPRIPSHKNPRLSPFFGFCIGICMP